MTVRFWDRLDRRKTGRVFAGAVFLVSVPVFFEAPLVRQFPELSLMLTLAWLGLSWKLRQRPATTIWGDLLLGFSWTWLAGSLYWGWLRWEPLWHLPVEAIALPFVLYRLWRFSQKTPVTSQQPPGQIGDFFYLGSLLGTAITDLYFYSVDLMGHWRGVMQVEPEFVMPILQNAIARVHTPWGLTCAAVLVIILLGAGLMPLRRPERHWWAFGGAVLSTILVDGLFWIAAVAAH